MRQRAALIRTLAIKPEILLLDEAFCLDYQTRLIVSDEVKQIIQQENKTSLLVTHDLSEAISMADKVVILTKRPGTIKSAYNISLTCDSQTPLGCREAQNLESILIRYGRSWMCMSEHEAYLRQRKLYKLKVNATQILLLVFVIAIWEIAGRLGWIDPFIMSQPSRIIETLKTFIMREP